MMSPTRAPAALAPARICSGACPFFEPRYDLGRKIAGTGQCDKHGGDTVVQVGSPCQWPKAEKDLIVTVVTEKRPRSAA